MKKLNLNELKVKSFTTTNIDTVNAATLKGGKTRVGCGPIVITTTTTVITPPIFLSKIPQIGGCTWACPSGPRFC